jgi:hypothetical protein
VGKTEGKNKVPDRQNFIELNGKRYDAKTGKLLPASQSVTGENGRTYVKPVAQTSGVALDGFVKHAAPARQPAPQRSRYKTERSKTLMRNAVKKPAVRKSSPKQAEIKRSKTRVDADPSRLARAKTATRHTLISKFGSPKPVTPSVSVLPVQPAPAEPEPLILEEHRRIPLDRRVNSPDFQQAVAQADGHNQPAPKPLSRRHKIARRLRLSPKSVGVAAGCFTALLVIGAVAYQNVPDFSMRVAAARAGISADLPEYQPAGFSIFGPIQYQPGQITVSFKSNSDERQFRISQRQTQWNSDALLESFVTANHRAYQQYEDSGKTIYIYEDNNATWVDGGIWYQIEGNSSLNSDQLLRIAGSM